jgi:hypothetical protein
MHRLPGHLAEIPRDAIPLVSYDLVGLAALRALTGNGPAPQVTPSAAEPADLPGADALIAGLAEGGPGVVMVMGKGGVGKTTVASAIRRRARCRRHRHPPVEHRSRGAAGPAAGQPEPGLPAQVQRLRR